MRFKESSKEFKSLVSVVTMAMLLALRLALGYVTTINVSDNLKIGFTIFPTTIACMLFGPVPGMVMGGVADIIGLILKPTGAYFFGYTLDAIVAGLIYGWSFYRREKISIVRVALTLLAVTVIVNLTMTTTWLCITRGVEDISLFFRDISTALHKFRYHLGTIFVPRLIKNACLLPVNVIGVYALMQALDEIPIVHRFRKHDTGVKKKDEL